MRTFIAMELGVSVENTTPSCWAATATRWCRCRATPRCAGIPITELLPPERVEAIVKRTAAGGAEIVALLKTGSAYYAPSSSTAEMVDAVLKDKHKILPCCCYLEGEFGIKDLYVGVPAQLGQKGVEKIWEIKLTDDGGGGPQEVGGRGPGAGEHPEAVSKSGRRGVAKQPPGSGRAPGRAAPRRRDRGSSRGVRGARRVALAAPRERRGPALGERQRARAPDSGDDREDAEGRGRAHAQDVEDQPRGPSQRTPEAGRRRARSRSASTMRSSVPPNGPHEILKRPMAYVAR